MSPDNHPWWRLRKVDCLFVLGIATFLWEAIVNTHPDPTIIYASVALMGLPVVHRIDGPGGPKP